MCEWRLPAATALKALKILGLEPKKQQLNKQDFIVFLYAMGLVRACEAGGRGGAGRESAWTTRWTG